MNSYFHEQSRNYPFLLIIILEELANPSDKTNNLKHNNLKEEKLFFFVVYIIVYLENQRQSMKELIQTIRQSVNEQVIKFKYKIPYPFIDQKYQ